MVDIEKDTKSVFPFFSKRFLYKNCKDEEWED